MPWVIMCEGPHDDGPHPLSAPVKYRSTAVAEMRAILEGFLYPSVTVIGDDRVGWSVEGRSFFDGTPLHFRYHIERTAPERNRMTDPAPMQPNTPPDNSGTLWGPPEPDPTHPGRYIRRGHSDRTG
jgi:hypothetical protein